MGSLVCGASRLIRSTLRSSLSECAASCNYRFASRSNNNDGNREARRINRDCIEPKVLDQIRPGSLALRIPNLEYEKYGRASNARARPRARRRFRTGCPASNDFARALTIRDTFLEFSRLAKNLERTGKIYLRFDFSDRVRPIDARSEYRGRETHLNRRD